METTTPDLSCASAPCGLPACRLALTEARQRAGFYKAMHQQATAKVAQLQQRIADLEAEVRRLKQRLYGTSSEGHHVPNTLAHGDPPDAPGADPSGAGTPPPKPRRRRGQQPGRPGHGRRRYDHLPATHETAELPPDQRRCRSCGLPLAPCGSEPDPTTLVEVEVRAHRRVIRRRRYRPTCGCGAHPGVVTAPAPPRLITNSALGISVWVLVLLDKYAFYRPTYRLLAQLRLSGLDLALGTLTDGLKRLLPMLEPVYEALREHNRKQSHWHGDETRWHVFATVEGKVGYLWYLWLVMSAEAAVFVLAAGHAHDVPEGELGPDARGIFNVDGYAAYPVMKQVKDGHIILALCWAHQRRDFIEVERGRPQLRDWASAWLEGIAQLYRLNDERLKVWGQDEAAFAEADGQLRGAVSGMAAQVAAERARADLPPACRQVLASLQTHWAGLTVFVEHPEVPMDNNAAERAERGPVVGRKNYYGSGSVWAGQLAAVMFSVLQTLGLWGINARGWLLGYLRACAEQGGRAPEDLRRWLPWSMTEAERAQLRLPGPEPGGRAEDSS